MFRKRWKLFSFAILHLLGLPQRFHANINAHPTTAMAAPTQAPKAGRCPVRHHSRGNNSTGDTDDNMPTSPALPCCSAFKMSVMPRAMASAALAKV